MNGGNCTTTTNAGHNCSCPDNWTGEYCDVPVTTTQTTTMRTTVTTATISTVESYTQTPSLSGIASSASNQHLELLTISSKTPVLTNSSENTESSKS